MTVRRVLLVAHRWLGLVSALILCIVGASGAILLLPDSVPLRRIGGPFHERLALGSPTSPLGLLGSRLVVVTTAAAIVLEFSGAILWWRRKRVAIRWSGESWRVLDDLHHSAGVVLLPLMLVLALSGLGLDVVGLDQPELRRFTMDLHTADPFSTFVKLLYLVASLGFVVQGVTGLVMWWKPQRLVSARRRARAAASDG